MVAVPAGAVIVQVARSTILSPRSLARTCRHWPPPKPPLVSRLDRRCVPRNCQLPRPDSKLELAAASKFGPFVPVITSTLSTKYSPSPIARTSTRLAEPAPRSRVPYACTVVHADLVDSSLSAQL